VVPFRILMLLADQVAQPGSVNPNVMNRTRTESRPPSVPRGVAVSGLIFAALYFASLVFARLAVPADPTEPGDWLADPTFKNWVRFALNATPFTGIAFLWFMGALRNRIGDREDRFFATVFLGSGLLFIAMLFAATAVAQGLLESFDGENAQPAQSEAYRVGRVTAYALMHTFAVKMSAVFIIVTSSIGLRTTVLPRWMAFLGYVLALAMLLTVAGFAWITLVFPMWVLLLSTYILVTDFGPRQTTTDAERPGGTPEERRGSSSR
jgi:MFS family permease